jgi:hypothetical protein
VLFANTLNTKAIGELGALRLAEDWSPVEVRAAVLLRHADPLDSDGGAIPDPALLVLDRNDDLHLVGIDRTSRSLRPSEEVRWWSTCRATVTSRRARGKNLLRVVEIGDATETLTLLAECFDPRQRAALELIERATGGRIDVPGLR